MASGRVAVVTGGGSGIGRASALRLADAGWELVVIGRRCAPLEDTVALIEAAGGSARFLQCDVADEQAVRETFSSISDIDVLVCCAGGATSAKISSTTLEQWRTMFETNSTSTFLCVRHAVPAMVLRGRGRIVVVASISAVSGMKYISAYTAAKHAAMGLVRSVACEVAGTDVTINAVCPAYVDTDMTTASVKAIAASTGREAEELREELGASNTAGRLIRPDEVAEAVAYLSSDLAGAVNGQAIVLGG